MYGMALNRGRLLYRQEMLLKHCDEAVHTLLLRGRGWLRCTQR